MIKTTIAVALAALALTGCMTAQQEAENRASYERLESVLMKAQENSTVDCTGADVCEKMWTLTKNYVQQNSGMAVRISDDSLIDTFAPVQYGMATFRATREPAGEKMIVRLEGRCRGMYNRDGTEGPNYADCARAIGVPQNKFLRYLHDHM